jgi:Tol biopolymer transport system component
MDNGFGDLLPFEFTVGDIPGPTTDSATFLSDITLPDGTVVSPGQTLVKTWRMRNTGSSTWGSGYQLVFVGGEQMGAPGAVNAPTTAPGQDVDLSVNLTAPSSDGDHLGYWQLRNAQGTYFGPQIWVWITVYGGSPPSDDVITLSCVDCPTTLTPGQTYRPIIRATVRSGQLLQSRGDMLRNTDGNLYGAWPHVAVVGAVNAGQSYDFQFYADNPLTAPSSEGTYESKWRVWRDGSWAGPEITLRFDVRAGGSNHRPNRPSALSPGDWWVQWDGGQVTLCGQHNGDPDGDPIVGFKFDVQGAQTWNSGEVGSNCATTSGLGFYTYEWRVQVKDSHGEWSDWSDPAWRFTIHNPAAIQGPDFYPSSPSASDEVWVWACSNGGTLKYYVNLANDGSDSGQWWQFNEGPICPDPGKTDYHLWPSFQTRNYTDGDHQVRVENGLGGVIEGTYTLLPRRPAPPDLLNPPHQSYQNSQTVLFTWDHGMHGDYPTRAASYTLRVSANSDPDVDPILDVTVDSAATSYQHTFDQDYATLYWHVIAANAQGESESGDIYRFGIDRQNPASTVNPLPEVSTDSVLTVSWNGSDDVAGVRWYDVQYRDGERGDWVNWQTHISHTVAIFLGQPGHQYYLRVRALDRAGNQEAYPADDDGDTFTTIDPSAAPPTAWWDQNYAYKRNVLLLNNDANTMFAGYPVWLHFDSGTTPSAAELYAASQSGVKGDDFRVVYSDTLELSRWVQNFTTERIDVWFQTQANIAGGVSSGDYRLYYGHPGASNPPDGIDDVLPPGRDANTMGLWHFADGTGSTFVDTSGRGHDGSLVNAYGWGEDDFGPYIEWYGGGDGAAWGQVSSSFDFDLNQLTLEAWVYPLEGGTSEMTIFYRPLAAPDDCPGYKLAISDSQVDLQLNCAAGRNIGGGQLEVNTWHHIAATFDGSDMRIYRNGSLKRTVAYGDSVHSTADRVLYLGGSAFSQTFKGLVRHARLSNVARTDFTYAAHIAAITVAPSLAVGEPIQPPAGGAPNLVVLGLSAYPNPGGGVLVQAVAQNQGQRETQNGFYTDLYLNHAPAGPGDYLGSLRFWVNDPITAGATVTFTTVITDLADLSSWSGGTQRVSIASDGAEADAGSLSTHHGASSLTGRYTVFASDATNLVISDTNGFMDVFVRDRILGTTRRVSVAADGAQGNGKSGETGSGAPFAPAISDNGRYVVFESDASNLVADDTNGVTDIFVHDLHTGTTTRVSIPSDDAGTPGFSPINEVTGTLYVQVDSTGVVNQPAQRLDNALGPANTYSATLEICVASLDAYESDDSFDTASMMLVDDLQIHNVSGPGDRDWIKFDVQADTTYVLRTFDLGPAADTYLYLYDTDGATLLASNDDYGGSLASQLEWTAPLTGAYYVLVQHWNPNVGGCGTAYTLELSEREYNVFLPLVVRNVAGSPASLALRNHSAQAADLVFVSERDGDAEIYTMNEDGSGLAQLTDNSATDAGPTWSPDGSHIAFHSARDGYHQIYVMDADGSSQTRLLSSAYWDEWSYWSPAGDQIAFSRISDPDGTGLHSEVFVMNSDGTNVTRMTYSAQPGEAAWPSGWSPDGSQILFYWYREGYDQLWMMNADGSNQHKLTTDTYWNAIPAMSPDGTQIAFSSLRDGDLEIYAMNTDGANPTRLTYTPDQDWRPIWSSDGSKIFFESMRDGPTHEIYWMNRDGSQPTRLTNNTAYDGQVATRVSTSTDDKQANGPSYDPFISADGRYIAFESAASNMAADDTNNSSDVFIYDQLTGQTSRVAISSDGTPGNAGSGHTTVSADGRFVAFDSYASNLVDADTNGVQDIFVRDRQTGQTTRVSVASDGAQADNNSREPMISTDGRWVVFGSDASNLVAGDTNGAQDVFLHDRETGATTRVSIATDGTQANDMCNVPSISGDGRYIAFQSPATNLVLDDTNYSWDVFLHDRLNGETMRMSVDAFGIQGNSFSWNGSVSSSGRFVTFSSFANNLVTDDTNGTWDVFVRERVD